MESISMEQLLKEHQAVETLNKYCHMEVVQELTKSECVVLLKKNTNLRRSNAPCVVLCLKREDFDLFKEVFDVRKD